MRSVFVVSDTHFGDSDFVELRREDGSPLRPWSTVSEHDEALIENWNKVVGKYDRVYHLGDVVTPRKSLHLLSRLNGKKVLVRGNHDIYSLKDYSPYFEDIRGMCVKGGMVLTHAPVHPCCKERFGCNIHGHLHEKQINDPFYHNVCVEHTDWSPISLEDLEERVVRAGGSTVQLPQRKVYDWSR